MKTIEQLNKQSDLIHTAALLGARYESSSSYEHLLQLPCGIPISVRWVFETDLFLWCGTYYQVRHTFKNPRDLARKIQSYVWVISAKWDQQNHPENK
jgi:hypothetical protein